MVAIARAVSRAFTSTERSPELEGLEQIVLLCGVGLLVSVLLMSDGVDLSPGLF
ncbi:hypothetical protein HNR60_002323 [Rhodopseudomonas rhenobacensis]|uniref:Uncharacterized protein n=1 Tax=Rhodopseudomonas rhenobacensis TaxID=87461 RepID=A0A7W7Z3X6_9BRAD|nr:hypothetical protein [Rhodopseudomonas rhenobacensis]MBB5047566.1 hypothetical protein [Rhodopseudomonas rhenobacensis]